VLLEIRVVVVVVGKRWYSTESASVQAELIESFETGAVLLL